ncbi:hypothetical protein [Vreelandella alkaliphila]|uniref:Uncharacterized protein n=1 Tax=Vreelandella alkaliphila TaxID=272774 RepID=A0A7C9JUM9_9GAMM|nr:hypothetical protein [Halomonas alkaliphila]NDL69338.1 hypothetical protein [Halomonas alkaliphila]
MNHTQTHVKDFPITLAETGEQLTVTANDWREALISVNRLDAIVVIHYPCIKQGKPQNGFAACRLVSLAPDPFPFLVVAENADAALDEALAAFKESR